MLRNPAKRAAALRDLVTPTLVPAAQFGTEEEAKAMLNRAVAALHRNREKSMRICSRSSGD
jgi:hypothetical protein